MKRVILGFSILALFVAFVVGCKKPKDNVVPEPDTEVQSSLDATWATFVITDIDMMCSFLGENELLSHFYSQVPGIAGSGTMSAIRDTGAKFLVMSFNNTACFDGRTRDGSVLMQYGNFSDVEIEKFIPRQLSESVRKDAIYTRSYGFGGFVTLSEFKVDGWKVNTYNNSKILYLNEITQVDYDPKKTKQTWSIKGKFKFTHPVDSNKNIIWDGVLSKTCVNSTHDSVFKATSNHKLDGPIIWNKGIAAYSGSITGFTSRTIPFTMNISSDNSLTRQYNCYAYKVGGVVLTPTAGVINVINRQFHPFISGIASFSTFDTLGVPLYPRKIYFGNEGNSVPGITAHQCDNTGEIYIKGISYRVDFRE